MLNRRGFFKAAAAAGAAASVVATAKAEEAPAPDVVEVVVDENQIPDGFVVGLGYEPVLMLMRKEIGPERVMAIYVDVVHDADKLSFMMDAIRDKGTEWRQPFDDAVAYWDELVEAGKLVVYDGCDYGDGLVDKSVWPAWKNGRWQSLPFVTRAEQEAMDELARA